jgi:hypothetical protein
VEPERPDLSEDLGDDTFGDGRTLALDGEEYDGHAEYLSLEQSSSRYDLNIDAYQLSPEFRADNGFVTRNDFRELSTWQSLTFRPNRAQLVEVHPELGIGRVWDYEGAFKDEWVRTGFWAQARAQSQFGGQYLMSRERFGTDVIPGIRIWSAWFNVKPWERLGFSADMNVGKGIYRDFDAPELADQRDFSAGFDLRPSSRTRLETSLDYSRMNSRERDETLFSGYILRNRLTVNFTRQLFVRVVVQWDDFASRLDVEPLLTYRVNPFTVFYVGSNSRIQQYGAEDLEMPGGEEWRQASRQFFAKVQYQFRM